MRCFIPCLTLRVRVSPHTFVSPGTWSVLSVRRIRSCTYIVYQNCFFFKKMLPKLNGTKEMTPWARPFMQSRTPACSVPPSPTGTSVRGQDPPGKANMTPWWPGSDDTRPGAIKSHSSLTASAAAFLQVCTDDASQSCLPSRRTGWTASSPQPSP